MKNVEDFYPLSPMQQGMLFHSLFAPDSGVYVEQVNCDLRGKLDMDAFITAWQRLINRHPILRSGFVGEALKEPVQVVHRAVTLPIEQQDWRDLSAEEQEQRLEAFSQEQRHKGFVLSEPPLMRLAFFRLADDTWRFVWTFHHILLDGWSNPILLKEVFAFYDAIRSNQALQLPPPRPFRDYIAWIKRQGTEKAEQFWRSSLAGFSVPTPLPVDLHIDNGPEAVDQYREIARWISKETTDALQSLARANAVTVNTIVQAVWALLLSRYSGEEDILFGATVSGRPASLAGAEEMIGLFINTLPVRVKIDPNETAVDFLKRLQGQSVEMRQYEYSTLVDIQNWSDVPRGTPLFNNILVFENYPVSAMEEETSRQELSIEDIRSVEQTNFPLNLVAGLSDGLMLKLLYDTRQFSENSIERLLRHLSRLVKEFAAKPASAVRDLCMAGPDELHQVLEEFSHIPALPAQEKSIQQLIEEKAAISPDSPAVTDGQETLTYEELNQKANQIGRYLQKFGIGPETMVAVLMERSTRMVLSLLGVFKAGAAYLPIDLAYPPDRIAFMLSDSKVTVILTHSNLLNTLNGSKARIICIDRDWPKISMESKENTRCLVTPDNLAYVIYTSGSTGKPKGVMIEHQGMMNLINWNTRTFHITCQDRATQVSGQAFDATVWEIWSALATGASLHIVPDDVRASPELLVDWLTRNKITISFLPTPIVDILLTMDWPTETSLRLLQTGGDRLHQFPRPGLPFELLNAYGPTENSCVSTAGIVSPCQPSQAMPTIGKPISGHYTYILDKNLKPVPAGVSGELYMGGVGLARGYLFRPELTLERFIDNPIDPAISKRLYKTGDLVRWLPDGQIDFLGRIDQQVKVRGFRIELGEIESVLAEHPHIEETAVVAREEKPGEKSLTAYVVPFNSSRPTPGDLREYLLQKLPPYMVPSAFVFLPRLPLTPNGKVDRKALPAPDASDRPLSATPFILPRDMLEYRLVQLWEEVLNYRPIGVRDNFFELGGHSMIAVRLIAQAQKRFNRAVPIMALFRNPTIEGMAALLRQKDGQAAMPSLVDIQPDGAKTPLFFIHPSGGSVHWYADLARNLGADQPFYGLQARGLDGDSEIDTTINGMASHYVEEILASRPQGPYLLGSWSMGVIVAYEMAQQLARQGREVPLLIMVDQGPYLPEHIPEDEAEYLVDAFGKQVPLSLEQLKTLDYDAQIAYVLEEAKRVEWIYPDVTLEQFSHFVKILKTDMDAWRKYKIEPYSGRITVIRATEQAEPDAEPDLGWGKLAQGGVDVIEITGNHLSIMHEPDVQALAEIVKTCLEKASVSDAA